MKINSLLSFLNLSMVLSAVDFSVYAERSREVENQIIRESEYPEVEGTHRDCQVQLLAPHKAT